MYTGHMPITAIIFDVSGVLATHRGIEQPMIALLEHLKPHYRLFALTNITGPSSPYKTALAHHFEAFVQSSDINLFKPDSAVFEYMLNTYHLLPTQTLFIDDSPDNVHGAQAAGLHGIVFTSLPQLQQELADVGIDY
jgi:2-haloacid dehalogenase